MYLFFRSSIKILFPKIIRTQNSLSPYQKEKIRANKNTVTLVSGGIDGTYIRFARDMADVLNDKQLNGLRVLPILGMGGTQNIKGCPLLARYRYGNNSSGVFNISKKR